MRSKVESLPPKIISYRTYKQFNEGKFKDLFLSYLNELEMSDLSVDVFKMTFLNALNSFAPVKKNIFVLIILNSETKSLAKQ